MGADSHWDLSSDRRYLYIGPDFNFAAGLGSAIAGLLSSVCICGFVYAATRKSQAEISC